MTKQQYVTIKGTKDGLVLRLDDKCAYSDMIAELRNKVEEDGLGRDCGSKSPYQATGIVMRRN